MTALRFGYHEDYTTEQRCFDRWTRRLAIRPRLTREVLAERVGVSAKTLQRWENGLHFPHPNHEGVWERELAIDEKLHKRRKRERKAQ